MDPYLEGEMWQEFHETLASAIRSQLLPKLAPKYVALLAKRYVIGAVPAELLSPFDEQVPVPGVEIRDVASRSLVTVIEILSPVNKRGAGAREYNERRIRLLGTRVHLLEIDLLRGGARIELIGELPPAPYYVFLSRWQRRPATAAYAIQLRDRLPRVPVPLLPPDADVVLDLQAAIEACFGLVGYERLLDYAHLPPPDLPAADMAWVRAQLAANLHGA